jgi:hypothetical protein
MKEVEIIDKLNAHYGGDALQPAQVYSWIKQVKSGRRLFQTPRHREEGQMKD